MTCVRRCAKAYFGNAPPKATLGAYLTPGVLAPGGAADIAAAPLPPEPGAAARPEGDSAGFLGCALVPLLGGGALEADCSLALRTEVRCAQMWAFGSRSAGSALQFKAEALPPHQASACIEFYPVLIFDVHICCKACTVAQTS